MPQISPADSYEYIDCINAAEGIRHYRVTYCISCQANAEVVEIDPSIGISLSSFEPLSASGCEYSVKYGLYTRPFESPIEEVIDPDLINTGSLVLGDILPIGYVEELLGTRHGFAFQFNVLARETVSLVDLRERELIGLSESGDCDYRQVVIANRIEGPNQTADLRNYQQMIGDLNEEIILDIDVSGSPFPAGWRIHIDQIHRSFSRNQYNRTVENALDTQTMSVLERVPAYMRHNYPESTGHSLQVWVEIPEILAGRQYTIHVTLWDPTRQVFYPTHNADLDRVLQNVHQRLLQEGIPLGPQNCAYQRVFSQLLLYRNGFLTIRNYAHADLVDQGEVEGFHEHLHEKLHTNLHFGPPRVISEPEVGNSRVDLLIDDIPTELKLERRVEATTDDIVDRHSGQAADYVSRCEAPLGFLVVLDAVEERGGPTSPARQDVRVTSVPTVSGDSVIVITVVVRVPPHASTR